MGRPARGRCGNFECFGLICAAQREPGLSHQVSGTAHGGPLLGLQHAMQRLQCSGRLVWPQPQKRTNGLACRAFAHGHLPTVAVFEFHHAMTQMQATPKALASAAPLGTTTSPLAASIASTTDSVEGGRGTSTTALPTSATAAQVQSALQWQEAAWPWAQYSPAIMEAVRAGVPVLGGNLPRSQARSAMRDQGLDQALRPEALERQREAIREGHCHLLAQAQVPGMARIQIARDKAMAQTLAEAHRSPGTTALLITGAGHTLRTAGVPVHLPKDLTVRIVVALQQKAPAPEGASREPQTAQPSHSQQATADAVGRLVPADADLVWSARWRDAPARCEALRKQLE
eukprot:gene26618-33224_t